MAYGRRNYVPADAVQSATDQSTSQNDANGEVRVLTRSIGRTSADAFMQPLLMFLCVQNHTSTILSSSSTSAPVELLPDTVSFDFFQQVKPDGYPEQEATPARSQPWRVHWNGPQLSEDGRLLIACPKRCDWGKTTLLGVLFAIFTKLG